MRKEERFNLFVTFFSKHQPNAATELHYTNPYELLVAVILSAQCTDKRVNRVTPALFQIFPSAAHLAVAKPEEVFPYIKSISYPNNKSKSLVGMAQAIMNTYKGEIPSEVDELIKIPGVGRKTANVIASVVYNKPAMAVDTHVFRVAARIGLTTKAKTPLAAEKQLIKYIPKDKIPLAHHWLILHGRYICMARRPKCESCPISFLCKYYEETFS